MKRDEIGKLLGGYATGTLTDQEREVLFAAALEDQSLFDALANEEALRALLEDPAARQRLLGVLGEGRLSTADRAWAWLRQPAVWALAGGLAAAVVVAVVILRPVGGPVAEKQMVARVENAPPQLAPAPPAPQKVTDAAGGARAFKARGRESRMEPLPAPPATLSYRADAAKNEPSGVIGGVPHFRIEPLAALPAAPPRPALGYTVLRKNEDGSFAVADASGLHPGDSVRFRVEPQQSGLLILASVGAAGTREVIYQQLVNAGGRYLVPPGEGIQLGSESGEKKLLLMLGSAPPPALRNRFAAARGTAAAKGEARGAMAETGVAAPQPPGITVEITLKYR